MIRTTSSTRVATLTAGVTILVGMTLPFTSAHAADVTKRTNVTVKGVVESQGSPSDGELLFVSSRCHRPSSLSDANATYADDGAYRIELEPGKYWVWLWAHSGKRTVKSVYPAGKSCATATPIVIKRSTSRLNLEFGQR